MGRPKYDHNGLTGNFLRLHSVATRFAMEAVQVTAFLETLADVAMSAAKRNLEKGRGEAS